MSDLFNSIFQNYGIYGILLILLGVLVYMVWDLKKKGWLPKIEILGKKIDNVESKIDLVEEKISNRVDLIEEKISKKRTEHTEAIKEAAREQTLSAITQGQGGRLSKTLRSYCKDVNCDHIFLGGFHNGTLDLRGLHYCKFDILIDEFLDPLHLQDNDTDFRPLYKDENVIAYGDLPYLLTHVNAAVFYKGKDSETLFDLSDIIYRRIKSRDVKSFGITCIKDQNNRPFGFIGCVNYDDKHINDNELIKCAQEIENIYNKQQ